MKTLIAFLFFLCAASAGELPQSVLTEIATERALLRARLCRPSDDPNFVVPRSVFMRELPIILGPFRDRGIPTDSIAGERIRELKRREQTEGFTLEIRQAYEAVYFDWRRLLEGF